MEATTVLAARGEEKYGRSLQPAVAEIVGLRLMRSLGIGTAPSVEIVETEEARRRDPLEWVFKTISSKRLKVYTPEAVENAGGWTLVVQKITRAVPLSFLWKKYGIDAGPVELAGIKDALDPGMDTLTLAFSLLSGKIPGRLLIVDDLQNITRVIWEGKPELPSANEFYADFVPPDDWSAVRSAIAWDSEQMLAIHATRLFLGTTTAHLSNVLVDPEGHLYSIDHEFCTATDGEDLRMLFDNIQPRTRAFEALRGVAQLSEEKLRALFEDLPVPDGARWFRWPLGSKEKTVAYYLDRLRFWKVGFEKVSRSSQ